LFLIVTPLICKMWSMLTGGAKGLGAFDQLGPLGGSINQIPVLVSDGLSVGQVVLVDASGVAANGGDVAIKELNSGIVIMNSTPDSPQTLSTSYVSLFQENLSAIVCERYFVAARLRSDACATLTNSNSYQSGTSPP
jgi:hypothetical protein